jgi:hypothetical protein
MRKLLMVGFLIMLGGCGEQGDYWAPSAPVVATQVPIPPTAAPITVTPVALTEIDLAPLLAQEDGLLEDYRFNRQLTKMVDSYTSGGIPPADHTATQMMANLPKTGFSTIFLYNDPEVQRDAYTRLARAFGSTGEATTEFGEESTQANTGRNQKDVWSIVFVRCRAVVLVNMNGGTATEAESYAQVIDRRIQESPICP